MRSARRWRLDIESEVAVLPAPSKSTADDYAGLVVQGDDYAVGAVCDGVTGREGQGGVAAARALEALRVLDWPELVSVRAVEQRLVETIRRANAALLRDNQARQRTGSAPTTTCTLGAVYVHAGRCYATTAWVGDSPAEVVTPYEVRPVTPPDVDHAASAPAALGARAELAVEVRSVEMAAGQALLLHSDGFSLESGECLRVYKNTVGDRHGWGKFLEQAMQRSGPSNDDKSALVIGIVGEPEEQPAPEPEPPVVSLEPAPIAAASGGRGLRPAAVVVLVLIAGALGWVLGHGAFLGLPASVRKGGITALGQPFATNQETGAVLSLSTLLSEGEKGVSGATWPVYTLKAGPDGPKAVAAGSLTLTSKGTQGGALLLDVGGAKEGRVYVDGRRAIDRVRLAPTPIKHKIEVYKDSPPSKWGCEVAVSSDVLSVRPLKARAEPR